MIVSSFLSFSLGLYIYHQVKAKQKTNREQNVNILLKKQKKTQFDPTLHIHIVSLAYKCTL